MKVTAITCFYNRFSCVQRIIRFFIEQDIKTEAVLLLYNNGKTEYKLENFDLPDNKKIILVNNYKDLDTGEEYSDTGAIFRDALKFVPKSNIITFFDSDDIFLENHLSQGIRGYKEAVKLNKIAYKPFESYFWGGNKIVKAHNNMEPSIFVNTEYVVEKGFYPLPSSYHQKWLIPLQENNLILEKKEEPTFIYNWSTNHNTFKISGLGDISSNFKQHRESEKDLGNEILGPISKKEYERIIHSISSHK